MCFIFLGYIGWAQSQYTYYLVEETGASLEPQSMINNPDGTLNLSFSNSTLNSFFQGKTIIKYKKDFPNSKIGRLNRIWTITLNAEASMIDMLNLPNVNDVYPEPEAEYFLFTPNDYNTYYDWPIGTNQGQPNSHLELIRARKAWDITQGNPSIELGVADESFDRTHGDLTNNILSYQGSFNNDPAAHGAVVLGGMVADTNNGVGVSSVAGLNNKVHFKSGGLSAFMDLINTYPQIRVVNASWGSCTYNQNTADAYESIRKEFNVLVVASAGNGASPTTCANTDEDYYYPASYDYVLSVSSVGHLVPVEVDHPNFNDLEWRDVHKKVWEGYTNTHQHNDKVDIVAPGYAVITTKNNNLYGYSWGTSISSPIVAGAAALIWSIKPSLTADQVENILKTTADDIYWIPYNQPYIGKLGSGRLNAFRAVKTAQCMDVLNPKLNLVVRDTNEDVGIEPNNQSIVFNRSEDIWVRNQNDGRYNEIHQSVEYSVTNPNYVYVRVTNYGCITSSGEDELRLYWSIAGTSLPWGSAWDGSTLTGGPIGIKTIPVLAPGQEAILEFEWFPPNPANYPAGISLSGNFSLLTRIVSIEDPITFTNGTNINTYVKNNSNVAWKNVHVVDISPFSPKTLTSLYVSNSSEEIQSYLLELIENRNQDEKPLYEEAEIGIRLDETIYNAWMEGGSLIMDISSTYQQNLKLLNGENPTLDNITLQPGETGIVELSFNFLTKELTDKKNYEYDVIQRNTANGEIVGSATILINKENRQAFFADAHTIENANSTTLLAENIGEPATYNWYGSEGNLIYTGSEMIVSPEITETYKLEIISDLDGFKDYKELEVEGNSPFSLNTLVPNPASSQVTISYHITTAFSAYLTITNVTNSSSNNYILNTDTSQTTIDLSNYPQGLYTVTLVCDGLIISSKNLIKN